MYKSFIAVALALAVVIAGLVSVAAQTSTARLAWDQPLITGQTFADVQAFTWLLKIDAAAATPITATCVAGAPIVCTTPLGPFATSGPHTLVLTATNAIGSASATLAGAPPAAPVNIKVVITVTVP